MRFVVDETSVKFAGLTEKIALDHFEQLLDRLDDVLEHGYAVSYLADLFTNPVIGSQTLYDLYEPNRQLHISREVQERVAVIFGRLPKWDDAEDNLPIELDVAIDNAAAFCAPSIAWVHSQARRNGDRRSACLVMPTGLPEGVHNVICENHSLPISFISSEAGYIKFFRWVIEKTTFTPNEMNEFANFAFPGIRIIDGATNGIKDMSKPYPNLVKDLVRHLSIFSDESRNAFSEGSWQNVPAYFRSKGINISDENGNTKGNRQAEKERTKVVDGKSMIFWWHSKLERDRDRIHVCPDEVPNGGKLVVGIFCRHLT